MVLAGGGGEGRVRYLPVDATTTAPVTSDKDVKNSWLIYALLIAVFIPTCGFAGTVYSYTGKPFQVCFGPGCGINMTAAIEVAAPLGPGTTYVGPGSGSTGTVTLALSDWWISDGSVTLTSAMSGVAFFNSQYQFTTDDSGQIVYWDFGVSDLVSVILGTSNLEGESPLDMAQVQISPDNVHLAITYDPGTWSMVPEPAAGLTLLGGLAVLAVRARRRAR